MTDTFDASLSSGSDADMTSLNVEPHELLIIHVDVGQGESTLLVDRPEEVSQPPRWVAIIDGGFARVSRGALVRYLEALNVQRVDMLICSHFDGDHTKGLTALIHHHPQFFDSQTSLVVRNNDIHDSKSETKVKLLNEARAKGLSEKVPKVGEVLCNNHDLRLTCVYTNPSSLQDENEGSIAVLLKYGAFRYYSAGDLPTSIEDGLSAECLQELHMIKCGHHGSANSTSLEFLRDRNARSAVISCGEQNFGHPSYTVIENLVRCEYMRGFYLTNCIHNRRGVNPNYDATEIRLAQALQDRLTATELEAEIVRDGRYIREEIETHRNALAAIDGRNDVQRLQKRILDAAQRALEHQEMDLGRNPVEGWVSGNADQLGSIVTIVSSSDTDPKWIVGVREANSSWTWRKHHLAHSPQIIVTVRTQAVESQLSSAIVPNDWEQAPEHFVLPPVTNVQSSPKKVAEDLMARAKSYSQFNRETIVGLREKQGSIWVPFCGKCRSDDVESDLLQVLCSECQDDEIFIHSTCREGDLKLVAEDPVGKLSVSSELCPFCSQK